MPPKYVSKYLSVGSGSIIGRENIEDFFSYVSMQEEIEDKSIAKLAPDYETDVASLVHMLEARFVNLNFFMQQMFLTLNYVWESEKKKFILKTLLKEFGDVVIEARKVFNRFNKLGSRTEFMCLLEKMDTSVPKEFRAPIPCKLIAIHDALERNFNWICHENLFEDNSKPKMDEKGYSKTHVDELLCKVEDLTDFGFDYHMFNL
jgi:hypothetical protein